MLLSVAGKRGAKKEPQPRFRCCFLGCDGHGLLGDAQDLCARFLRLPTLTGVPCLDAWKCRAEVPAPTLSSALVFCAGVMLC